MKTREVVLCRPVRTAIGAYNGSLKATPATELGAAVIRETVRRSGVDPERIGSVVFGNVIQAGNRMNPARQAAIGAGLPVSLPATSWSWREIPRQRGFTPSAWTIFPSVRNRTVGSGIPPSTCCPSSVVFQR